MSTMSGLAPTRGVQELARTRTEGAAEDSTRVESELMAERQRVWDNVKEKRKEHVQFFMGKSLMSGVNSACKFLATSSDTLSVGLRNRLIVVSADLLPELGKTEPWRHVSPPDSEVLKERVAMAFSQATHECDLLLLLDGRSSQARSQMHELLKNTLKANQTYEELFGAAFWRCVCVLGPVFSHMDATGILRPCCPWIWASFSWS